jgi:hypothetical protein
MICSSLFLHLLLYCESSNFILEAGFLAIRFILSYLKDRQKDITANRAKKKTSHETTLLFSLTLTQPFSCNVN